MRIRLLRDPVTERIWESRLEGNRVTIRSGKSGREKESGKVFDGEEAALKYVCKEEWSRLKKGFVLSMPDARDGQPRMLRFIGSAYTGAMIARNLDGNLLCNRFVDERETLFVIGDAAAVRETVTLPWTNTLVWEACVLPDRRLLLEADHRVEEYVIKTGKFSTIAPTNRTPAGFVAYGGGRAAWFAEPDLVVKDMESGRKVFSHSVTCDLYGGHSSQMCGTLSPDGRLLACCAKSGEIMLFDVDDGRMVSLITGDFAMIAKMVFDGSGRHLLALERYGRWRLLCFDANTGLAREGWAEMTDMDNADTAFDYASRRLAVSRRGGRIEIFDFETMQSLCAFVADHVIKRCAIDFVGPFLGLQTDCGCVGLYAVE